MALGVPKPLLENEGKEDPAGIRTTEVCDGRFTVCSLWPLGNLPTNQLFKIRSRKARLRLKAQGKELVKGLEPATC